MSALVLPRDKPKPAPISKPLRCECGKLLAAHYIPGRWGELVIRCGRCGHVTTEPKVNGES